jgi:hypothetical protein
VFENSCANVDFPELRVFIGVFGVIFDTNLRHFEQR